MNAERDDDRPPPISNGDATMYGAVVLADRLPRALADLDAAMRMCREHLGWIAKDVRAAVDRVDETLEPATNLAVMVPYLLVAARKAAAYLEDHCRDDEARRILEELKAGLRLASPSLLDLSPADDDPEGARAAYEASLGLVDPSEKG